MEAGILMEAGEFVVDPYRNACLLAIYSLFTTELAWNDE